MTDTGSGRRARPKVAVSMGDPNGIGPEILATCLRDATLTSEIEILPVGDPQVLAPYIDPETEARDGHAWPGMEVVSAEPGFVLSPGTADPLAGALAMASVARAITLCLQGRVDAMTTCPISKEVIARAGFDVPGHTEFIARETASSDVLMMMVSGHLRVGLVTAHMPLSQVASHITQERISRTIRLMSTSLKRDFGIRHPRIAVLGLNPHAGDGGVLGTEEEQIIIPTMAGCADMAELSGPFPADGFFGSGRWEQVDGVVAMYHDQGLGPFKALSFGRGVNFSAGLPIIRTSPDHGTGFDIAGKGLADASSLKAALHVAAEVARQRATTNMNQQGAEQAG